MTNITNKRLELADYPLNDKFYQDLPLDELKRLLANIASKKSRSKSMSKMENFAKCQEIEKLLKNAIYSKNGQKKQKTTLTVKNVKNCQDYAEINKIVKNIQSQKCLAKLMNNVKKHQKMLELEEIAKNVKNNLEPVKKLQIDQKLEELAKIDISEEIFAKIAEIIQK